MKLQIKIKKSGKATFDVPKPNWTPIMHAVSSMIVGHIIERTSDGVDVEGKQFKGYDKSYSIYRRLTGRSASPVQLVWSGKLMNAVAEMSRKASGAFFVIVVGIKPRDERNLIGSYLQRTRRWFGISDEAKRSINKWMALNIRSIFGEPLKHPPPEPRPPSVRSDKAAKNENRKEARAELKALRKQADADARKRVGLDGKMALSEVEKRVAFVDQLNRWRDKKRAKIKAERAAILARRQQG